MKSLSSFIIRNKTQLGITLIFIFLLMIFVTFNPRAFTSWRTYSALMEVIPFTIILALPLTLLVINREMDLSFASIMTLGAYSFTIILLQTGNELLAFLASIIVGSLAGLLNGVLVTKFKIPSLILTLGTNIFWDGTVLVLTQGTSISLVEYRNSTITILLVGKFFGVPIQVVWSLLFAVIFYFILNRHRFGAAIYYIGDNPDAALMAGYSLVRIKIILFTLMGAFSSLVGLMSALYLLCFYPTTGEGELLKVIATVFVGGNVIQGGIGTIYGSVIAAFLLGFLTTGVLAIGFSGYHTTLIYGLIIVLALVFYSHITYREGR